MAEWLRRGLQILARRFDSGSGLHFKRFASLGDLEKRSDATAHASMISKAGGHPRRLFKSGSLT